MNVTLALKERFCKDLQLPIKIFQEPYFTERLKLYDKHFHCMDKYEEFLKMLEDFEDEQAYFMAYNSLKETVIQHLSANEDFDYFSKKEDMSKYDKKHLGFPKTNIYKESFIGKHFVSFDLCKGNFTALYHYSPNIFEGKDTYEEFIGQFTTNKHFIESKYIRQVIFGALNPKRQVKYEEYLMDKVMSELLKVFSPEKIVYFSTDEIVVEIDPIDSDSPEYAFIAETVNKFIKQNITIRADVFQLSKVEEYDAYIKNIYAKFFKSNGDRLNNSEFKVIKNANNLTMPFVLRKIYNLPPDDNDNVFMHEGRLAKFIT
jgi:hypothetical protein